MSYRVENTPEEIGDLVGATIVEAKIATDSDFDDGQVVRLVVAYRDNLSINDSRHGVYEVWQDPEGNGPGFVSFIGPAVFA